MPEDHSEMLKKLGLLVRFPHQDIILPRLLLSCPPCMCLTAACLVTEPAMLILSRAHTLLLQVVMTRIDQPEIILLPSPRPDSPARAQASSKVCNQLQLVLLSARHFLSRWLVKLTFGTRLFRCTCRGSRDSARRTKLSRRTRLTQRLLFWLFRHCHSSSR